MDITRESGDVSAGSHSNFLHGWMHINLHLGPLGGAPSRICSAREEIKQNWPQIPRLPVSFMGNYVCALVGRSGHCDTLACNGMLVLRFQGKWRCGKGLCNEAVNWCIHFLENFIAINGVIYYQPTVCMECLIFIHIPIKYKMMKKFLISRSAVYLIYTNNLLSWVVVLFTVAVVVCAFNYVPSWSCLRVCFVCLLTAQAGSQKVKKKTAVLCTPHTDSYIWIAFENTSKYQMYITSSTFTEYHLIVCLYCKLHVSTECSTKSRVCFIAKEVHRCQANCKDNCLAQKQPWRAKMRYNKGRTTFFYPIRTATVIVGQ